MFLLNLLVLINSVRRVQRRSHRVSLIFFLSYPIENTEPSPIEEERERERKKKEVKNNRRRGEIETRLYLGEINRRITH